MTSDDDKRWLVISCGDVSHVTSFLSGSSSWQESCRFLLSSTPSASSIGVKVKSKRLITSTVANFDVDLAQFDFENTDKYDSILFSYDGTRDGKYLSICIYLY